MNQQINRISLSEFWNEKYIKDEASWELDSPTPVFEQLLKTDFLLPKGSVLVIGCGSGHDSILFAENGYEVTAIDFSSEAIRRAKSNAEKKNISINFLTKDLFHLVESFENKFDYVLEYVTFCAIDPNRQEEYARVVHSILKNHGKLVALFFPLVNRAGHVPPFPIEIVPTYKMFSKFFRLKYFERSKNSVKPRLGNEVLMIWEKIDAEKS